MNILRLLLITICCLICNIAYSQSTSGSASEKMLSKWVAGVTIPMQSVINYGINNCFKVERIDDTIYSRIKGLSYKDNCTVPIDDLRYVKLLHYNGNGMVTMGEIVCNKAIGDDLLYIFRELFDAKYRIESVRLVDEYGADDNLSMINNNTSSFNFRYISGTTQLSKHSLGLAIDINPLYNPYVKDRDNKLIIDPIEAKDYVDRSSDFPYKIDTSDLCYKLFIERGFEWGGNWNSLKDYQHFEK